MKFMRGMMARDDDHSFSWVQSSTKHDHEILYVHINSCNGSPRLPEVKICCVQVQGSVHVSRDDWTQSSCNVHMLVPVLAKSPC